MHNRFRRDQTGCMIKVEDKFVEISLNYLNVNWFSNWMFPSAINNQLLHDVLNSTHLQLKIQLQDKFTLTSVYCKATCKSKQI